MKELNWTLKNVFVSYFLIEKFVSKGQKALAPHDIDENQ
jgi:hypothetical protein